MPRKSVRQQDHLPSTQYYVEVNDSNREGIAAVAAWYGVTVIKPTLMPDENHRPRSVYLIPEGAILAIERDSTKFGNPKIYVKFPGQFGITLKHS